MTRGLSVRLARDRVVLLREVSVPTGKGGFDTSWQPVGDPIPAEVIAERGREETIERVLRGARVYRVTIRWRGDVLLTDRLQLGTETVNIRSAVDPTSRREELLIIGDTEGVDG